MDIFQKKLSTEGISGESAGPISNVRRPGAKSHYESYWRKWIAGVLGDQLIPLVVL